MAKDETPQYDPQRLAALWEYVWMSKKERRQVHKLERELKARGL